jgi:VWFA-related protein
MHLHLRVFFALLGSTLACATTCAQPPGPAASQRIVLDVVAAPKSGPPVTGLQQQDFTVLDNGVSRPIASFAALGGPQAPVEVVLLIDGVNTGFQTLAFARAQIDNFLKSNEGRLAHPTALAILTDTGTQMQQDFSTDGNSLSAALDQDLISLRQIRRNSVWGAEELLDMSVNALNLLATKEAAHPGRKIILWVSPGWPLLSGPDIDFGSKQTQQIYAQIVGLSTMMRRARITLYGIDPLGAGEDINRVNSYQSYLKGVTKPSQVALGNLSLQVLAIQSGGLALGPSNDTFALLQRALADTTAYYELSFDVPPPDRRDEYHTLQIKIDQPGLTARTRTGYYAEP